MSSPTSRNYRAEYQRRIANAAERGLSRSQARGHARHTEVQVRPRAAAAPDERLEQALKTLRQTGNRAAAAKSVNIAPERLRRFLRENVTIDGRGRTLKITDTRHRDMTVLSRRKSQTIRLLDYEQASLNGAHLAASGEYLRTGNIELLRPFEGRSVFDWQRKAHPLETNPNALHRIAVQGDEVFHEIYRLIPIGG